MTDTPHLHIVVIEDHDALREATVEFLRRHGHHVTGLVDAESVAEGLREAKPDLYVIDLNLPGEDGLSLARRLRAGAPDALIILATARDQLHDRIKGYESGADLYLTKPFHREELLAAIESMARRLQKSESEVDLELDTQRLTIKGPAASVGISKAESTLLAALLRSPGQSLERWQIVELLTGDSNALSTAGLEMRMGRLRRKIAKSGAGTDALKSIYGRGYVLSARVKLS